MRELFLSRLCQGCPSLTSSQGTVMAEAAAVCLSDRGHEEQVSFNVNGHKTKSFYLHRLPVTEQMQEGHNDLQDATEYGACGIAILLVQELAGLTTVQRSRKGTGFDYWLGDSDSSPNSLNFLKATARLEVSGILDGNDNKIKSRVKQKWEQVQVSDHLRLPAYIVVVEFGRPKAQVELKP